MCIFFLLSSQLRLSFVSVVFDFNASLNGVVPVSPMLLPIEAKRKEKSELLMDVFCVFFLLSSLHRLSSVSVVFDFNDLLNDVAPVSPISFPVDVMRNEIVACLWTSFVCLFCLHPSN